MLKIILVGFDSNVSTNFIISNIEKIPFNLEKIDESQFTYDNVKNVDLIICGSDIKNIYSIFLLNLYNNKVIFNINNPEDLTNVLLKKMIDKNLFYLTVGSVSETGNSIKYPLYIDLLNDYNEILKINNLVKDISINDFKNKKPIFLNSDIDPTNIYSIFYNILSRYITVVSPGKILNNLNIKDFNQIDYVFSICPENYNFNIPGCISNSLALACLNGNIPIYFGKLDEIDKQIFNIDRIIYTDEINSHNILKTCEKILYLLSHHDELYKMYKLPIFVNNGIEIIKIKENFKFRLNNFINKNDYWNFSLLKNQILKPRDYYNKINGVDHIVWINLDRSTDRRKYMENLLSNINIPNTRITAIDGKTEDLSSIEYNNITNYEVACTLSHIKAYSYLKNLSGNYFLIVEDDISFLNLKYFDVDLQKIINDAPEFDILQLSKTFLENREYLTKTYVKKIELICSTVAYVVSKKGLDKLLESGEFNFETNEFKISRPMMVADHFIYNHVNTITYKYNFILSGDIESIIHPDYMGMQVFSEHLELQTIINDIIYNLKPKINVAYTDFWCETKGSMLDYDDINDPTKWNLNNCSRELSVLNNGVGLFHINKLKKDFPNYNFELTDLNNANLIICSYFGNNKYKYPNVKKIILGYENECYNYAVNKINNSFLFSSFSTNVDDKSFYNLGLPFLYFGFPLYRKLKEPRILENPIKKFCICIVSNPVNKIRNDFIKKLSEYKQIDCYGKLFKNISNEIIEKSPWFNPNIYDVISEYKFMICIENSKRENYWTEKLINGYIGKTIPIYWGDPNINDVFNSKSFININNDFDKAINIIKLLDNNLVLYERMYSEPLITSNKYDKYYSEEYYEFYMNSNILSKIN